VQRAHNDHEAGEVGERTLHISCCRSCRRLRDFDRGRRRTLYDCVSDILLVLSNKDGCSAHSTVLSAFHLLVTGCKDVFPM
jgi:hypothetical protein